MHRCTGLLVAAPRDRPMADTVPTTGLDLSRRRRTAAPSPCAHQQFLRIGISTRMLTERSAQTDRTLAPQARPRTLLASPSHGQRTWPVSTAPAHACMRVAPRSAAPVPFPGTSPLNLSLRSGAVVILTSASRSGGEVRITEAQRSDRVPAGGRGCRARIAARNAGTCERGSTQLMHRVQPGATAECRSGA